MGNDILDALLARFNDAWESGDTEAANQLLDEARNAFRSTPVKSWAWFAQNITDEFSRRFSGCVFRLAPSIPKRILPTVIRAAIYETDPSFNRYFVEPCIRDYGLRRVNEMLLEYLETGTNFERAGAVNALYWAQLKLSFPPDTCDFGPENANPESRKAYFALKDIWDKRRCMYLQEFVRNDALDVRRSIIPSLKLDPAKYPDELKALVPQAIEIARTHPDDYIRHRVEVQLGNKHLLRPIPEREDSP